jgi:WD40 repeat protein
VIFSRDGEMLISGSDDDTIILWKVETGEQIYTLEGHDSWVLSVALSPDGKILASGSRDGTIFLWDMELFQ